MLTPDTYQHTWSPLTSATFDPDTGLITVRWSDGVSLRCHPTWIAENSPHWGFDPTVREGLLDVRQAPTSSDISEVGVVDGALEIRWNDERRSVIHPGWLRHVADDMHLPAAPLPQRIVWTSSTFGEPPTTDAGAILNDDAVLRRWLDDLVRYGLARLTNAPTDPEFLSRLMAKVGPVRGSNFGDLFTVASVVEPDSTANTGLHLGQHTDLPTRETPPGYQFLHCVENTVAGGASRMTDGLALIEELRHNHPDHFEALTTLEWVFFNRQRDADHRWIGPTIDFGGPRNPVTIRGFYPVRSFPHMDAADIDRAYAALRIFTELAHDPRLQITFPFSPGDVVGFDNRQVLHGRDGFEPSAGSRVLRGCYLDADDVLSRARVLAWRASCTTEPAH